LGITAYTHSSGTWVEVTRLATGVRVSTRYEQGYERRATYQFRMLDQRAAMGFTVDADALRFTLAPLDADALRQTAEWPAMYRRFGNQYFLHLLMTDRRTAELELGDLEVEWLWQIAVTMVTQTAASERCSLAAAVSLVNADYPSCVRRVLEVIFQNQPLDINQRGTGSPDTGEVSSSTAAPAAHEEETEEVEDRGYLAAKLLDLACVPEVQSMLTEHLPVLWEDGHPRLNAWLDDLYAYSLGNALFAALSDLTPDVQPDDLHMDVEGTTIWITESSSGGVGLVAKLADAIAQHPRRLDLQLLRTTASCQREELAGCLDAVSNLVLQNDRSLAEAFAAVRSATDLPRIEDTRLALAAVLDGNSIPTSRELSIALNAKFLRPNSGPDTDELIAALVALWRSEEARLGCEIDLRVMVAAAAENGEIQEGVRRVLTRVGEGHQAGNAHLVFNLLQSLLWLTCRDSCPDCIQRPGRYQVGPRPSRALIRVLVSSEDRVVSVGGDGWLEEASDSLGKYGQVTLAFGDCDQAACKDLMLSLLAEPVESGYQALYPAVEKVERQGQNWSISLILPELVGA